MKQKIGLLFILFSVGNIALADAIYGNDSNPRRSAIQSTNIILRNNDKTSEINNTYNTAIDELQNKIKQEPTNYILNVHLADLYIKSRQYTKAINELIYISNLKNKKALNESTLDYITKLNEKIKNSIKYNSLNANLYAISSILNLICGNKTEAEKNIQIAGLRQPTNETIINALKHTYDTTQNIDGAIETCSLILAKYSNSTDIRKIKANYLLQTNKIETALNELSDILQITPNDEEIKYTIYKLLSSKNATDKELMSYLYKDSSLSTEEAYVDITSMLLKNNETADAKIFAERLTKKFPNNAYGFIYLSEIYRKEGNLEESYKALREVRNKAGNNETIAHYNVLMAKMSNEPVKEANALINNGLYSQALEVLDVAAQDNLYVMLSKSVCYYALKEKPKALEILNKAMSFYPNNADVYYHFALIFFSDKEIETAKNHVDNALKIQPDHNNAKILLDAINKVESDKYINDIISSIDSQNYKEAMRLINKAIEINQKDSILYLYKGITYIALNDYASSTSALYKAMELDKNNLLTYYYLGIAFDNLSEYSNALTYYKTFIEYLPKDEFGESEKLEYAKARVEKLSQQ